MGGSQGASGVNELVLDSLPLFAGRGPEWQWLHIAGSGDAEKVMRTYASMGLQAMVHAFLDRMELALGAATVAVSRAGASSLAELAAMRVPAILIPYPAATDNHQFHNARALEAAGAARLLEQKVATPEMLVRSVSDLMENRAVRAGMRDALAQWHKPGAAEQIAEAMLTAAGAGVRKTPGDCPAATTDPDRAPPGARNHPRTTGLVLDSRLEQGRPVACSTPVAAGRGP
jgi:UDP-N-acetylglucosamine--N-acetylmuramyl-(pentapeptide) pyrophosphoryl-undecaprenol N-acetylglucosamine transferase